MDDACPQRSFCHRQHRQSSFTSLPNKRTDDVFETEDWQRTRHDDQHAPLLPSSARSSSIELLRQLLLSSSRKEASSGRYASAVCRSEPTALDIRVVSSVEESPTGNPLAVLELLSPGVVFAQR